MFDVIPNICSSTWKDKIWKALDVKKNTINFLRIAGYLRLREFDFQFLLLCERFSPSFYLTQDGNCENHPSQNLQENWRIYLGSHAQQLFLSLEKVWEQWLLLIVWRMIGRFQLRNGFDNLWRFFQSTLETIFIVVCRL